MIQHILKIIWTERRVNLWILIELTLIFCIIWFCADYLNFMCRRYLQPLGFDIENTYMIELLQDEDSMNQLVAETGKSKEEIKTEYGWTIFDRIEKNPDIEHISISVNAYPYNGGMNSSETYINDDTIPVRGTVYDRIVSPGYFDVFKIKLDKGSRLAWDDLGRKVTIVNGDDNNYFGKFPINEVDRVVYRNTNSENAVYKVVGCVNRTKRDPFYPYENEVYKLFDRSKMAYLGTGSSMICVRIKDNVDQEIFAEKFTNEMYDQLNVGPFYLSMVTPFTKIKDKYMFWQDYDGNFKSIGAIVVFLLINIFLGLIGTFWFRTRERRNEIGLRMAIGSSQSGVMRIFIGETLLLAILASVIGTLISVNIGLSDILKDIGVPVPDRSGKMDWIQYVLNFSLTFFTLAIVSTLAVWYPAGQASKTLPAIALRDE